MLRKNSEIAIDPKNPFAGDALDRKPSIELLTKLAQSTTQPFVLSVEAHFGFGKTTFLNLWKAHARLEGHLCLDFNAWENDFVEDPMIAFLGEMARALEEAGKNEEGFPLAEDWKKVEKLSGKLFRKVLPIAVQVGTVGLMKTDDVKELMGVVAESADELGKGASEFARKKVEEYESSRKTIKGFRQILAEFANNLAKREEKKKPILFFIDELDRCRPDFAVALLERIKHLFHVEGFFFVLSIDRRQLGHSVQSLFGSGTDVDGYLRRFIDLRFNLPKPSAVDFAGMLYDRYKIREAITGGQHEQTVRERVVTRFASLANHFGLSLRVQEQCFTEINIAFRAFGGGTHDLTLTVFLVCLRAAHREIYDQFGRGEVKREELLKLMPEDDANWRRFAEAVVIASIADSRKRAEAIKKLEEVARGTDLNAAEEARQIDSQLDQVQHALRAPEHVIIRRLELLPNFKQ
jgi:hypothetical protein